MHHLSITHNRSEHKVDSKTPRAREGQWFRGRKPFHVEEHGQLKWLHMSLNRKNSFDADKNI
jgi:hypothetical protein